MSNTENKNKEEPPTLSQEKPSTPKEDLKSLSDKAALIQIEALNAKQKELEEVEKRIDDKITNFKKFVDNTEMHGKTLGNVQTEKTAEQQAKEDAIKLGGGLLRL